MKYEKNFAGTERNFEETFEKIFRILCKYLKYFEKIFKWVIIYGKVLKNFGVPSSTPGGDRDMLPLSFS